jgi:hypothetical protein
VTALLTTTSRLKIALSATAGAGSVLPKMRRLFDYLVVLAFFAVIVGLGVLLNFIVSLNYDFFAGVFFTAIFWALIAGARRISKGTN